MKIMNPELISDLRILCYNKFEFEMINQKTRDEIKWFLANFLISEGYNINTIKSDQENNPPTIVDSGRIIVHIFEATNIPHKEIIHTLEI